MGGHKESVPVRDSALKLFPIAEIFLIQSKEDPTFWQILSIWYNLDDLKEAQNRGSLPGELIFVWSVHRLLHPYSMWWLMPRDLWKIPR
jgi:hypothetical protein